MINNNYDVDVTPLFICRYIKLTHKIAQQKLSTGLNERGKYLSPNCKPKW